MSNTEYAPCPRCYCYCEHKILYSEDDGNDAERILKCSECGFEWSPAYSDEDDDGEHESTFEEQFENANFAQDEYPNGYEDDGDF